MAVIQANLSTQSRARSTRRISVIFENIPLDNPVAVSYPKWTAEVNTSVRRIRMKYVWAAAVSGDTVGTTLALGQDAEAVRFGSWVTSASETIWTLTEVSVPAQNNILQAGKTLILFVGTGKTGGGMVNVQVELDEVR